MYLLQLLSVTLAFMIVTGLKLDFKTSKISKLSGPAAVTEFKGANEVRLLYYYKKNVKFLNIFFRELENSAEYLDLYGVKIGFCNCSDDVNALVEECKKPDTEKSVHTYRLGNSLLALELETMFDVNAIMSNILQLVLLKEVPILQTQKEVEKYLRSMRGKQDVVFGHMKAIGTFDHRVFMEVAYAYNGKLKFVICTDKKATKMFDPPPDPEKDASTVWWIWTKKMAKDDTSFHNIRYKGELSLTAIAKFAKAILVKPMFDMPAEGFNHPYYNLELSVVRFYYNQECMSDVYQKAHTLTLYYGGTIGVLVINIDAEEVKGRIQYNGPKPSISIQHKDGETEYFLQAKFTTDNIATFMEEHIGGEPVYPEMAREPGNVPDGGFDEEQENDDRPPGLDLEAVEKQDDHLSLAVQEMRKIPMKLDFVPAFTDKTFPETLQMAETTVVMFYFPFEALNMGNLRLFGDAVTRLGKQTTVTVGRVNCFDWTDVCQQQNIVMYPTLRVFKNGQFEWDYKGPQDTQAFYSTLALLYLSLPVYVSNKDAVLGYMNGDGGRRDVSNVTVTGLFKEGDTHSMDLFKELAHGSKDRIMFVYSDIKEAESITSQFKTSLPAVIMSKYDDTIQPQVAYDGKFNLNDLQKFIEDNKLPKLSTLTPLMFPEIRRRFNNLLILFSDGSQKCQLPQDAIREIVKTEQFNNISFNVLPVPDNISVGYKVLHNYTQQSHVPHIALVRFQKGEVFNFDVAGFDSDVAGFDTAHLTGWLTNVMDGTTKPSTMLADGDWKPKNKGYEFLKIIDWEQERDRKKAAKKTGEKVDDVPDEVPFEPEEPMPVKLVPMEETEDSETRRDLFDLHNSRLYHQAPGRHGQGHKKDAQVHDDGGQDKNVDLDMNNNKRKKSKKHDEL